MLSEIIKKNSALLVIFSIRDIHFIRNVRAKQYKLLAQTLRVSFNKMDCSRIINANFFKSYSELSYPKIVKQSATSPANVFITDFWSKHHITREYKSLKHLLSTAE